MRYLVTSSLPYINGVKHLGNLVGSILPADVYSRFLRQKGEEVIYICGTDDHGTPAEISAAKAKMDIVDFCDIQFEKQKTIYEQFGIAFDFFGRTSRPESKEITQEIGKILYDNGILEVRTVKQVYSIDDQRFLSDRYIVGECPYCGYELARGDQCENCTKVLDPTDLKNPKSAISGSTNLEIRESDHLFLLQSKLVKPLKEWVESNETWSKLVKSIAHKWLDEGIEDRCITRDLNWGVPVVGVKGLENKVYYVWFDAPIGYLGITKEWAKQNNQDWKSWWYDADDVFLTQFMAKDNIPFHAITFPSTLIGTNQNIKKVNDIKGFNWLTYYGGKFSTSQHRGIFTDEALKLLPADYWRYYLMSRIPESSDSSFSWEDLQTLINKDINSVLGNFISRVLKLTEKEFNGIVPEIYKMDKNDLDLIKNLSKSIEEYENNLAEKSFRKALNSLRYIWTLGNEYITISEPWKTIKNDKQKASTTINLSINLIRIFSVLSSPIIPYSSEKMMNLLNIKNENLNKTWIDYSNLTFELSKIKTGHKINPVVNLFEKIEDDKIEQFKEKFGGEEK